MDEILRAIAQAAGYVAQLRALLPEIEANWNDVREGLGSHDDAAVRAKIDEIHIDTNNLTAQLNALRDPVVPDAGE